MPSTKPYPSGGLPAHLSRYVYGTTRLGDEAIPFEQRVAMARSAVDAGVWLHTSDQYGDALRVLGAAFDLDRARVPSLIVKIGWSSVDEIRTSIQKQIAPLGVDHVDVGQLCLGGPLAEDFAAGGDSLDGLRRLKDEGLVRSFALEIFPWTSELPSRALAAGYPDGLVDAFIFYLNPLQRFASNALWDLMIDRGVPLIAMRTVAGGDVHRLRDVPGAAWKDYLQQRAVEVAPIFERSGASSWVEFCVRFAHGVPLVRASVGATSQPERLRAFLSASGLSAGTGRIEPLAADVQGEILELQRRWSDETDVHAEPWSM